MLQTGSGLAQAIWESGEGIDVEYSLAVIEKIRRLSVDGFNAFPHGGKETGGILYGVREEGRITVLSFAELDCEHALGPRLLLSEKDRQVLAGLLQPKAGLEPVGWFRAHTRGGLDPDSHDTDLFDRYFPQPLSVALILKPTHWGPASAAFFVRGPSGAVLPSSAREFPVAPINSPPADICEVKPPSPEPEPIPKYSPPASGPVLSVVPPEHKSWIGQVWMWSICAFALLAAVAVFTYAFRPVPKISLQAYAIAPRQVRIEWTYGPQGLSRDSSAVLQIADGASVTRLPLDSARISSGSLTYVQQTGRIGIRLRVDPHHSGAAPSENAIEFVSALPPEAPPETSPVVPPPAAPVAAEVLPQPSPRITASTPVEVAPAPKATRPELPFQKPPVENAARASNHPAVLPVPPPVELNAAHPAGLPDFLSRPAGAPPPLVRSGRLIWTGALGRRGVIEIDGGHASLGSLEGALPGLAVRLNVLPAEFGRDGLIVFTADALRAGKAEAPSQGNGWNSTHFRLDDARAHQLVILEAPNRANDYKRLVLRNDGRDCSVILVDWSLQ